MAERKQGDQDTGIRSSVVTQTKPKTQKPSMYRVLILNDDYTPMEFVVYVLEQFFNKSREDATRIMLHVHQHGVGVCGVFTYEVAETKVHSGVISWLSLMRGSKRTATRHVQPWPSSLIVTGLVCGSHQRARRDVRLGLVHNQTIWT